MLWKVRYLWPSGYRCVFNCYLHWSLIVLRNMNGIASFLNSREGATQGDPPSMIAYGISILPLIKNIKRYIPDVTQPWYANYVVDLGTFARIETYFNLLTCQGLGRRFYTEPFKRLLIVHPENLEAGKEFGARHRFKVCTGTRYLRGYIEDDKYKIDWMRKSTPTWEKNIIRVKNCGEISPGELRPGGT